MSEADRPTFVALIGFARDKVPYEGRRCPPGQNELAIEGEVLRLRQRFKEWAAAQDWGGAVPPPEGCAMGDVSAMPGPSTPFTADQLFDPPDSPTGACEVA